MTNIKNYLDDGANWQAQAVLAYLRYNAEDVVRDTWNNEYYDYDAKIEVGRYENCREQGYVFTINYKMYARNYAVYQYRSGETLVVLIANGPTMDTPQFDYMWNDHGGHNNVSPSDYDRGFSYGQITKCGDYIIEDMKKFINDTKERLNHNKHLSE